MRAARMGGDPPAKMDSDPARTFRNRIGLGVAPEALSDTLAESAVIPLAFVVCGLPSRRTNG